MKFLRSIMKEINSTIVAMGIVSLFNDMASEMVSPLIPIFLSDVLHAPIIAIGLIEGLAEGIANILKVFSGVFSDVAQTRKPFVLTGYTFGALAKFVIGIAQSWHIVLLGRFMERFGKGIRASARDAMISEVSTSAKKGHIYGFANALDTVGAVFGPILGFILLYLLHLNLRTIFFISLFPALFSLLIFQFFVFEKSSQVKEKFPFKLSFKFANKPYIIFILISILFSLGNSSFAFVILRAQNLGMSLPTTLLAYALFNFSYASLALPFGIMSDKIGHKKVMIAGYLIFSFTYFSFALIKSSFFMWLLLPIFGVYMALTDGIAKAYISDLVSKGYGGSAFGFYQSIIGLCSLISSLIAGVLWTNINPQAPFFLGGFMALIACVFFVLFE